jgi:hypothetical protein
LGWGASDQYKGKANLAASNDDALVLWMDMEGCQMKDEALDLALEALTVLLDEWTPARQAQLKGMEAVTAIKQARALNKKAEENMIYKTFEQWKSGNVLEHGVPRTEHYSEDQLDLVEMGWSYGYDAGRAVEQSLDKKAENASDLGLDYEPVQQEPVAHAVIAGALFDFMGWLTSRKERLVLSSADNASPAVEAITEFAKMRGLSLNDAKVQDWNTSPPAQRTWVGLVWGELPEDGQNHDFLRGAVWAETKLKEKNQ